MRNITINGGNYISSTNSITISNGKVIIDGKEINTNQSETQKEIIINISGDITNLDIDYCKELNITGNIDKLKSQNGNVIVGGDSNSINTVNGDVKVKGNVKGSINTVNGDIHKF